MKKNLRTFLGLSRWGVGAALLAFCAFTPVSRAGVQYSITFTDGGVNYGSGTIDLTGSSPYTADSGTFTVNAGSVAAGTYNLVASGTYGPVTSDNLVTPSGNPFVDLDGLVFTSGSDSINLDGLSPNNYNFAYYNGSSVTLSVSGTAMIAPVPEPITYALAVFGLIFVGGSASRFYIGRRSARVS